MIAGFTGLFPPPQVPNKERTAVAWSPDQRHVKQNLYANAQMFCTWAFYSKDIDDLNVYNISTYDIVVRLNVMLSG